MNSIDQQVLKQLYDWLAQGINCWLCTIVKTIGSSPRPVGSLLACNANRQIIGSLSGGCVEDDLIEKIINNELATNQPELVKYGITAEQNERVGLPCGGRLHVLVEALSPERRESIATIIHYLDNRQCCLRQVELATGKMTITAAERYEPLIYDEQMLSQSFGPRFLLLLVGAGHLASCLAPMAMMLDYRVIVCDPRPNMIEEFKIDGVELIQGMPDDIIREQIKDSHSVIVTLTHDPRIDDMALMEALTSKAFYIGALGSKKTSEKRRQRMQQLGLSEEQINRLHAPVGLGIGSKTPPEIAIAILAELTQLRRQL